MVEGRARIENEDEGEQLGGSLLEGRAGGDGNNSKMKMGGTGQYKIGC